MEKAYKIQKFVNVPDPKNPPQGAVPLSGGELSKLATALDTVDTRVVELDAGKVDAVPDMGLSKNDYSDAEKTKVKENGEKIVTIEQSVADAETAIAEAKEEIAELGKTVERKVDKVPGKGLSTNDYTNEEMGKVAEYGSRISNAEQTIQGTQQEVSELSEYIDEKTSELSSEIEKTIADLGRVYSGAIEEESTGTLAHIEDSADAPIRGLSIYGKSEQEQYSGVNLINAPFTKENPFIMTALNDDYSRVFSEYTCYLESGQTYNVSYESDGVSGGNVPGRDDVEIYLLKDNAYSTFYNIRSSKSQTITVESGKEGTYTLKVDVNKQGATHSFWNFLVTKGAEKKEWEPYVGGKPSPSPEYPQEIKSVGDDGTLAVDLCGNNILQYPYAYSTRTISGVTFTDNGDGSITVNGTNTGSTNAIFFIFTENTNALRKVFLGKNLAISGGINSDLSVSFWNADGNDKIAVDSGNGATVMFTNETGQFNFVIRVKPGATINNVTVYPMIRLEGTDNSWEPPKFQTATITTGLPLRSIGDVRDELRVFADGTGEVVKKYKSPDIIDEITDLGECYRYRFTCKSAKNRGKILCRYTDNTSLEYIGDYPHVYAWKYIYLFLPKDLQEPTADDVIYELEKPEIVPLTAEEVQSILSLHTYKPVTNITADGAEVKTVYVADTKAYIDNKFNELANALVASAE